MKWNRRDAFDVILFLAIAGIVLFVVCVPMLIL